MKDKIYHIQLLKNSQPHGHPYKTHPHSTHETRIRTAMRLLNAKRATHNGFEIVETATNQVVYWKLLQG